MKTIVAILASVLGMGSALATTETAVIQNIATQVIVQTYADFDRDALDLKSKIDTLIQDRTQENLEAAQLAWKQARWSYEVSEGFLFGPIDSLGVDPMIDSWPLALTEMKQILASDMSLTADTIRDLSTEVQGFHALEYILFGEGIVSNTRSVTTITEREYAYLSAVGQILTEQTNLLVYAWTVSHDPEDQTSPSYFDIVTQPSAQNPFYKSAKDVVMEYVNGIVLIIGEASGAKLPDAAGEDIEDANASLEESPFSWNSIVDYTSNVDSIYNVYTGSYEGVKRGPGLKDLVALQNPQLAQEVEEAILLSRAMILEIPGPEGLSFGKAIKNVEGRKRIFAAIKQLQALEALFTEQVAPLLEQ